MLSVRSARYNVSRTFISAALHQSTNVFRLASTSSQVILPSQPATPILDPSFDHLLDSVNLKTTSRRRRQHSREHLRPLTGKGSDVLELEIETPESLGVRSRQDESLTFSQRTEVSDEEDGYGETEERREERRSPAAVLGSKRIGMVVLPELLQAAIQKEVSCESPVSVQLLFRRARSVHLI